MRVKRSGAERSGVERVKRVERDEAERSGAERREQHTVFTYQIAYVLALPSYLHTQKTKKTDGR